MNRHAVKTHCKKGHPLAGENIYQQGRWRRCKECRKGWGKTQNELVKRTPELRQYHTDKKREWYERTRIKAGGKYFRLYKYNMTEQEYDRKFVEQDGLCAICRTRAATVIDHDHRNGKVRGLLCHKCNILMGSLETNEDTIQEAYKYKARWM